MNALPHPTERFPAASTGTAALAAAARRIAQADAERRREIALARVEHLAAEKARRDPG